MIYGCFYSLRLPYDPGGWSAVFLVAFSGHTRLPFSSQWRGIIFAYKLNQLMENLRRKVSVVKHCCSSDITK